MSTISSSSSLEDPKSLDIFLSISRSVAFFSFVTAFSLGLSLPFLFLLLADVEPLSSLLDFLLDAALAGFEGCLAGSESLSEESSEELINLEVGLEVG